MKTKMVFVVLGMAMMSGCASITGDSAQKVRVETYDQSGNVIADADCTLENDFGKMTGKSSSNITTHRSSKDLFVECKKEGYPDASAKAISRANGGMFGNIIFGGGIGAIIDHNKGTAYTYPEWLKLVFGSVLTFDRSDDKEGQPSLAKQNVLPTQSTETQLAVKSEVDSNTVAATKNVDK